MRPARTTVMLTALLLLAACGAPGGVATVEPGGTSSSQRPGGTSSSGQEPDAPSSSDASTSTGSTGGSGSSTELSITTSTGQGAAADERTYRLTCDPAGGDHPDPESACAVIAELGAGAFAPPPKDQACTEQYGGPQTASVTGVVAGTTAQATFDRTDGCGISRWDALAPVLAVDLGGTGS